MDLVPSLGGAVKQSEVNVICWNPKPWCAQVRKTLLVISILESPGLDHATPACLADMTVRNHCDFSHPARLETAITVQA